MLLYDIYYTDGTMDLAIKLPAPKGKYAARCLRGAMAACVNGERKEYRFDAPKSVWVEVTK